MFTPLESRTVERLETINAVTGREFPISGDARPRMEAQLFRARLEAARLLFTDDGTLEHMEVPC